MPIERYYDTLARYAFVLAPPATAAGRKRRLASPLRVLAQGLAAPQLTVLTSWGSWLLAALRTQAEQAPEAR